MCRVKALLSITCDMWCICAKHFLLLWSFSFLFSNWRYISLHFFESHTLGYNSQFTSIPPSSIAMARFGVPRAVVPLWFLLIRFGSKQILITISWIYVIILWAKYFLRVFFWTYSYDSKTSAQAAQPYTISFAAESDPGWSSLWALFAAHHSSNFYWIIKKRGRGIPDQQVVTKYFIWEERSMIINDFFLSTCEWFNKMKSMINHHFRFVCLCLSFW